MKVIKKYFKVALCFMAFALLSFAFAVNPSVSVYGALSNAGSMAVNELRAIKMPTEVDVTKGESLSIPKLEDETREYTIRVYDTAGQHHDFVVNKANVENDTEYFTENSKSVTVNVTNNGNYSVVYILETTNGKVYSNVYSVKVKNISYALNFTTANGLKALVKPTVDVAEDETDFTKWIKLPTPTVEEIAEDGNKATAFEATVKIAVEGAPATVNVGEPEKGTMQVFATKSEAIAGVTAYSTANTTDNVVKKRLQVVEITSGDEAGLYVIPSAEVEFDIQYSYNKGAKRPSAEYTISVVKDYKEPEELTVKTPKLPSFEVGDTDIELPKLTVSDEYHDNIEYNIEKVVIKKSGSTDIYQTLENNDLTFDMTKAAFSRTGYTVPNYEALTGTYEITYTIVDAYNNRKDFTYKKEKVTISEEPKVYFAYDYTDAIETDASGVKSVDADDVNTNFDVDIKSEYKVGNIVAPAAFATDKVADYNDLIIVRTIVDSENTSSPYYIDNVKYENGELVALDSWDNRNAAIDEVTDAEAINVDVSKAVPFKFETENNRAGKTYILRYYAYSKSVKTRIGKYEIKFKVVDNLTESTPEVEIEDLGNETYIKNGDEVTFKVNATDKDSRLATRVFTIDGDISESSLQTIAQTAATNALNHQGYSYGKCNILDYAEFVNTIKTTHSSLTPVAETEAGKNEYSFVANKNVTIVAITVNDNGNVDVATKLVIIKNTSEEGFPQGEVVANALTKTTYTVGDKIKLPTIKFTDTANVGELDKSLALSMAYYINEPITSAGVQYNYFENCTMFNNTITPSEFRLAKAGDYTVIYSAMDDSGNVTSYSFSFTVEELVVPSIEIDVTGKDVKPVDGVVTAESGAIIQIDAELINSTEELKLQVINGGLKYTDLGDNRYQFFDAGQYTFKFSADGVEEQEVTINIKPIELKWVDDEFATVPKYEIKGETVFLPMPSTNIEAKIDVKVTLNGDEVAVNYVNDGWEFVADKEGAYKVQYTAENANYVLEDSSSKFTINVGDNVKPKFAASQQSKLTQDIIYDGTNKIEYKVKVDTTNKKLFVTIVSNGNYIYKELDIGLTVTDKNDSGSTGATERVLWRSLDVELSSEKDIIEDGEDNQWFITGTGEVVLTITADDGNNVGELPIKFNVVRETEAESDSDTVTGIVLIIVSLVVLAGVIGYFTFAGKKGGSKKSRKNRIKSVEETEEVEVEETKVEDTKVEEAKTEEVKEEKVEEQSAEETPVEESTEEEKQPEQTEIVEEKSEDDSEAKSGDVE